jgi:hypothetical protein
MKLKALLVAFLIAAFDTSAEAVSIVSVEATFDYAHVTFTIADTLMPTTIFAAFPGDVFTGTTMTPPIPGGLATATASSVNGVITIAAGAVATDSAFANTARAFADVSAGFSMLGTGSGTIVINVPYHLEIVGIDTTDRDFTSAFASVFLSAGPGRPNVSDAIELIGAGGVSRDGVLTISDGIVLHPNFFAGVGAGLFAEVRVLASVPESSSIVLLGLGLSAVVVSVRRRLWAAND